jgi:hypothetical protein
MTKEQARELLTSAIHQRTLLRVFEFDANWYTPQDGKELPNWMEEEFERRAVHLRGPTRMKKGEEEGEFLLIDGVAGKKVQTFPVVRLGKKFVVFTDRGALSVSETEVEQLLTPMMEQLHALGKIPVAERKPLLEKLARSLDELSFEQEVKFERRPYSRQYYFWGLGLGATLGTRPSLAGGFSNSLTFSVFPEGRRAPSVLGIPLHLLVGGAQQEEIDTGERPWGLSFVLGESHWISEQPSEYRNANDPYFGVGSVRHLGYFMNLHVGLGWSIKPEPRWLLPYVLVSVDVF